MRTIALLIASAVLVPALEAQAAVITFQEGVSPTVGYNHAASYVRDFSNGTNTQNNSPGANGTGQYNGVDILVGTAPNSGAPSTSATIRSLLSFPGIASAIPAGSTIDSVTLTLKSTQNDPNGAAVNQNVSIDLVSIGSFNENSVTWATQPALGSVLSQTAANPKNVPVDTAVTFPTSSGLVTAVQSALDGNAALNLALKLSAESPQSTRAVFFFFSDEPTQVAVTARRPLLTVNYTAPVVPEPTTAAASVIGLSLLLRRR